MTIPDEISSLIDRIDRELYQTEQSATQGLNLVRQILENFPDNAILIQFFAYLGSVIAILNDLSNFCRGNPPVVAPQKG